MKFGWRSDQIETPVLSDPPTLQAPPWQPLPPRTLDAWSYKLRSAMAAANRYALAWEERSQYLKDYCRENRINPAQARRKRAEDWELVDAFASWDFNTREVQRISAAILGELALRQINGFDRMLRE